MKLVSFTDLGFTGTESGMTVAQMSTVIALLHEFESRGVTRFHHGDCVGSDAQADFMVRSFTSFNMHIHPPLNPEKRAFCSYRGSRDVEYPEAHYLIRNRDIVQKSNALIATPKEYSEVRRSGTWATYRYAIQKKILTIVVWPDGLISVYHPNFKSERIHYDPQSQQLFEGV